MRLSVMLIVLFAIPAICFAQTTWYVPDDFSTIQRSIADPSVLSGDTVIVRPGTYLENINFLGKAIVVRSRQGPVVTVIDGGMVSNVIRITSGERLDTVVDGFTLTHGFDNDHHNGGGGILCRNSSPTLVNNRIVSNVVIGDGGGILVYKGSPLIDNNLIMDNQSNEGGGIHLGGISHATVSNNYILHNAADLGGGINCIDAEPLIIGNTLEENTCTIWGGGILCNQCDPVIKTNVIMRNSAKQGGGIAIYRSDSLIEGNLVIENSSEDGGGMAFFTKCRPTIANNWISGNRADHDPMGMGGGFFCDESKPVFVNNTIIGNTACNSGGGLYCHNDSDVKVRNSIFWANEAPTGKEAAVFSPTSSLLINYCDVEGGIASFYVQFTSHLDWGLDMLDANPLFVDQDNKDFHLTYFSPCKDAGNNLAPGIVDLDFEDDPRIADGTVDIGADEFYTHLYYTGDATPSGTIQAKFVGLPGTLINGVILGVNIFDPPLPCDYGMWYMDNPMQIITGLGTIPSSGVAVFPGTFPSTPPAPYTIYLQAAINSWLTNLCTVNVQ